MKLYILQNRNFKKNFDAISKKIDSSLAHDQDIDYIGIELKDPPSFTLKDVLSLVNTYKDPEDLRKQVVIILYQFKTFLDNYFDLFNSIMEEKVNQKKELEELNLAFKKLYANYSTFRTLSKKILKEIEKDTQNQLFQLMDKFNSVLQTSITKSKEPKKKKKDPIEPKKIKIKTQTRTSSLGFDIPNDKDELLNSNLKFIIDDKDLKGDERILVASLFRLFSGETFKPYDVSFNGVPTFYKNKDEINFKKFTAGVGRKDISEWQGSVGILTLFIFNLPQNDSLKQGRISYLRNKDVYKRFKTSLGKYFFFYPKKLSYKRKRGGYEDRTKYCVFFTPWFLNYLLPFQKDPTHRKHSLKFLENTDIYNDRSITELERMYNEVKHKQEDILGLNDD